MFEPTLQAFHPIQFGKQLVDHAVCYPRAVMASSWCQRVELIKEQDARFGTLCPETKRKCA